MPSYLDSWQNLQLPQWSDEEEYTARFYWLLPEILPSQARQRDSFNMKDMELMIMHVPWHSPEVQFVLVHI